MRIIPHPLECLRGAVSVIEAHFSFLPGMDPDWHPIASIHHKTRTVQPSHGYFAPHYLSEISKTWAKNNRYTFNNN